MFNSFEGEYKDGKRNGEGKEFYKNKKIKFEGEYLDGKRWKGKGYNPDGNLEFEMENGLGYIKEYFSDGKVKLEAKYVNGVKHGLVKEYNILYLDSFHIDYENYTKYYSNNAYYYLEFEGEYENGKRNGRGKEYSFSNKVIFEGEYLNGKRKSGKEYIGETLEFEGKYLNGKKLTGKISEFYNDYDRKLKFKGDHLNGKKWNGIGYDKNGKIIYELKNGKG